MDFDSRYKQLNTSQREAVDHIDGPVMVIAGPGTGKTELLSMRAANILKKTDTLPDNILCLTFTDSGADAMRKRLTSIIGKDANKVAIHTFHSFGSEVMNQNREFFYHGAAFQPADELSSYQIIRQIFDELEYSNPLASKMNGEYTHLSDTLQVISELKRSGLTSDELLQVLDSNDAILDQVEPQLQEVFSRRISATTLAQLLPIAQNVAQIEPPLIPAGITPLSNVISLSLAHAVDEASAANSTKPITAWKNRWLSKDEMGTLVFKARGRQAKLRAVSYIYFQYLARMQEAQLYDYDDMILRVVHAMEVFGDLRLNLQEQYQYIMVDEFQDTNLAQMRILHNLTNNEVHGDTPNILVVGDDDQAIYSFQGADISNILSFQNTYPAVKRITLTDNYRSAQPILERARAIITQGTNRLEHYVEDLDKTLVPHAANDNTTVELHKAPTKSDERAWLVEHIAAQIAQGVTPSDITVLARRHYEIVELLPYFAAAEIAVDYERRNNVLELEPITQIEQLARVVIALHESRLVDADALLPELLSHPAWGIHPTDIWKLSTQAYDKRSRWFDQMAEHESFQQLHAWFTDLSAQVPHQPLEHMLDLLIGKPHESDDTDSFRSPLYQYFFSDEVLADKPDLYLTYLEALRTIRTKLREYRPDDKPSLTSFINFIDLHRQLGSTITSIHTPTYTQTNAVHLMTAHKSKGLEFDTVYIFGANETMWGERARSRSRLIAYPDNLPLAPAGETADERLRLFFVAATRAKRQLFMSFSAQDDAGKDLDQAGFLLDDSWQPQMITPATNPTSAREAAEHRWYEHVAAPSPSLHEILRPTLERYKLSATHLGAFLDISRGGPQTFLLNNLLHFPQRMSPAASFGSAIHSTLQRAHAHLAATDKQRALEDILNDFEHALNEHRLTDSDRDSLLQKGIHTLQTFLAAKYDSFVPTQKAELSFAGQYSTIGEARLTGVLDLVDINKVDKTMVVTDYKTGSPISSWRGRTEYEKIKLHKYRQQLLFYKLLVEHSRDFGSYEVGKGVLQFVEPDKYGAIMSLELEFESGELERLRELIQAVWRRITTLDLPSIESYEPTLQGILAFEQDLIDNNI